MIATATATPTMEHIVRGVLQDGNVAFVTGPMTASKGRQWAQMERDYSDTAEVTLACDEHCWCQG